ncbi:MAG: hypothetical protein LBL61_02095 [Elusimicrobiota bacterium]|jgi:hypothetical protein|nr:hypothetical protein [Elusimicrobiota bacterium]
MHILLDILELIPRIIIPLSVIWIIAFIWAFIYLPYILIRKFLNKNFRLLVRIKWFAGVCVFLIAGYLLVDWSFSSHWRTRDTDIARVEFPYPIVKAGEEFFISIPNDLTISFFGNNPMRGSLENAADGFIKASSEDKWIWIVNKKPTVISGKECLYYVKILEDSKSEYEYITFVCKMDEDKYSAIILSKTHSVPKEDIIRVKNSIVFK